VRYGVLADVHGNLPALEATLATLQRMNVDRYLVAGDLVGYGPFPNESVAAIAGLDAVCVAGNHDLIALGHLSDARCIPLARTSLEWTRRVLHEDARAFLDALPIQARAGSAIAIAHGSLDDPSEYTLRPEQAVSQLAQLASEEPELRVLVLGHTHRQWACNQAAHSLRPGTDQTLGLGDSDRWVINPGAVGQTRGFLVRARFAVLDDERSTVSFHSAPYDVRRCSQELRRRGLYPRSYQLRPSPWRRLRRVVRRALRRSRRS
jgi:predicted phosphodiesterase